MELGGIAMIDKTIRQIVAEELQKMKSEVIGELSKLQARPNGVDRYGETLTVDEVAAILKVSKSTIYELARNPRFPCKRIGSRIVIPTRKFFEWMNEAESI